MKILIFGANGWIGSQFRDVCDRAKRGGSDIDYRASEIRRVSLDTQTEIIEEIADYKPTHVVSFLGRTHGVIGDRTFSTIDYLEQGDKLCENLRDNLVAPLVLAYICKYAGVHFTYLGTGCIFHYKDEDIQKMLVYDAVNVANANLNADESTEPVPNPVSECYKFTESDSPNFFGSSYSIVKGLTDKIMQERNCICENVLNLRIRMPIINRDNPRNFVTKIAGYAKVCSLPNSMTVLDEFLPYALVLMRCRYAGTLNFVNPGVISHNEILNMYKEHVNPDFEWTNFTVEEQNEILASKRSNNYLDNTKLLSVFPKARSIRDAMEHCMRTYNTCDESDLHLDQIECTVRVMRPILAPQTSDEDGHAAADADALDAAVAAPGYVDIYNHGGEIQKGGDFLVNAAHYAGTCTRILSQTVGTLYNKMLHNRKRPSSSTEPTAAGFANTVFGKIMAIPKAKGKHPGDTFEMVEEASRVPSSSTAPAPVPGSGPGPGLGPVPAPIRQAVVDTLVDDRSTVVCVTGGAGFIGSHFINFLWSEYEHVRILNLDCLYYCANVLNIDAQVREDPCERYKFYNTDLAELGAIKTLCTILKENAVTHVVHFAAQSHVQNSFGESLQYTRDNVVGTHNLLEAARLYGGALQRFIHVSTDEVYGESMIHDGADDCKTEGSVLCPTNPYAATKAAAEMIAQSYYHSFKLPLIITRGNNVYGPNQYPEKLIPRFIKLLQTGQKLTVQGNGSNIRSFVHVSDVCRAFGTILSRGSVGEIYNIGGDDSSEYSVLDVAKRLIKLVKGVDVDICAETASDIDWIEYVDDRPFNDKRYYISNNKLKQLGWETRVDFMEGLGALVQMSS
jgi:dTDP-glucose 4,6-dehydratase